jgi:hypothetical protein
VKLSPRWQCSATTLFRRRRQQFWFRSLGGSWKSRTTHPKCGFCDHVHNVRLRSTRLGVGYDRLRNAQKYSLGYTNSSWGLSSRIPSLDDTHSREVSAFSTIPISHSHLQYLQIFEVEEGGLQRRCRGFRGVSTIIQSSQNRPRKSSYQNDRMHGRCLNANFAGKHRGLFKFCRIVNRTP